VSSLLFFSFAFSSVFVEAHVHTVDSSNHKKSGKLVHKCEHDHIANDPIMSHARKSLQVNFKDNHDQLIQRAEQQKRIMAARSKKNNNNIKDDTSVQNIKEQEETLDTFAPMRITFRTDAAKNDIESRSCTAVGQQVRVGYPASTSVKCTDSYTSNCWDTCTDAMVVTPAKLSLVTNQLLPSLKRLFESILQTRRLPSNLRIGPDTICGNVLLPSDIQQNGVNAAVEDLVVMVTLRPKKGVLGYASYCGVEPVHGRPFIGLLNMNPTYLDSKDMSAMLSVAKHELIHLLAFSPDLYSSWIDSTGNKRTQSTDTVTKSFRDSTGTLQKRDISRLVTPQLVYQLKNHFNCPTATGVDLEESGSSGSAGSHFEASIFMNEVMTASDGYSLFSDGAVFSQFSFALLEDSGWYKANWTYVEVLHWGRKTGCNMLNNRCEDWNLKDNTGYFCSESKLITCNFEHTTKSCCDIRDYQQNLGYYEHLSNPAYGGSISFMDYCPFAAKYDNTDCRSTGGSSLQGEVYGSSSACFNSNAAILLSSGSDARCFKFTCDNNRLNIMIGSGTVTCPSDQSFTRITNLPAGYSGYVECPFNGYDLLCGVGSVSRNPSGDNGNTGSKDNSFFCKYFGLWCKNSNSSPALTFSVKVSAMVIGGSYVLSQVLNMS